MFLLHLTSREIIQGSTVIFNSVYYLRYMDYLLE